MFQLARRRRHLVLAAAAAACLVALNSCSSGKSDAGGVAGWSGVYLFAHVMAKATSFTGQDVIHALNAVTKPIQGGVLGPFVGSGTPPFPQYPRLFNASYLPGQVESGKIVPTGGFVTVPANILKQ
jgi:hypothetical protein